MSMPSCNLSLAALTPNFTANDVPHTSATLVEPASDVANYQTTLGSGEQHITRSMSQDCEAVMLK